MALSSPAKVMHLIHSLEMGGAQKVIATLVKHHDRNSFLPVVGSLRRAGPLEGIMKSAGAEVVYFDKQSALDFGCAGRIAHYIRDNNIRVVNAHNFSASFWGRLACKGFPEVKFVITEHGRTGTPSTKLKIFNRVLAGDVDVIIAVSEETADFVKSLYPYNARKVRVVINGIDIPDSPGWDKKRLAAEFGIPETSRVVVNVAAHTGVKDQALLLRAFKKMLPKLPEARLLLIGDGPLRNNLESLSSELGLTSNVIFAGERIEGPDIVAACDVFCLSSRNEGTSIAALEAIARSCPVVLTAVGGNPALIIDRVEGSLVQYGDPAAMGEALLEVLIDNALAKSYASASLSMLKRNFSAEEQVRATEKIFAELIS